jgi:hypothetical protein
MKNFDLKKSLITVMAIFFLLSVNIFTVTEAREFFSGGINDLTDIEKEGILFMREEEKLARDVYLTFNELYVTTPVFSNIADSEQRHMDAIKTLIVKYGLEDPTEGKDIGEFTNQELQQLYHSLISAGSGSLISALEVGAEIEEIDIIDLKEYISQTDKIDIIGIYQNLLKGSENHLRAFVRNLKNRGETYTPRHLSQEEFDDIINKNSRSTNAPKMSGNMYFFNNRLRNKIQKMLMLSIKYVKNKYNGGKNR